MSRTTWPARTVLTAAGVVAAVALWQTVLSPQTRALRYRAEMMRALQSPDPKARKRAAWAIIERPDRSLEAFMIRGVLGAEPNPDMREAYVYSLGRLRDPRNFAALESAIDLDPSGYVRAAAWLAAARCDPQHFRTLAATRRQTEDPWDRIGVAQGGLWLGDVRGVNELFEQAISGNDSQRYVASRALFKWLRPLLDAAGRWPADLDIGERQVWPPPVVAEIKRRCGELDLQAVADDTGRHGVSAGRVRHNVMRVTRVREGLAGLLFAQ